jgi:hypothetical protein
MAYVLTLLLPPLAPLIRIGVAAAAISLAWETLTRWLRWRTGYRSRSSA